MTNSSAAWDEADYDATFGERLGNDFLDSNGNALSVVKNWRVSQKEECTTNFINREGKEE